MSGPLRFPPLFPLLFLLARLAAAAAPSGLSERPHFSAFHGNRLPPEAPAVSGAWSAVDAFPNLQFINPLGVLPIPGTSDLVVWEREGRVYSFRDDPTATEKNLMLDLHDRCAGWGDQGLLGLAFHPQFTENLQVYLWYNWVPPGTVEGSAFVRPSYNALSHQRLSRFTFDPDSGTLIPGSEYILIELIDFVPVHAGGGVFFGPTDGCLYLTNGEDASSYHSQLLTLDFRGCMMRIDVDKRPGNHPPKRTATNDYAPNFPNAYYIPHDNPFVGVPNAVEEIFALGLRSPHRATVDPVTERIYIGDVGNSSFEEINIVEAGDRSGPNFQWDKAEGFNGTLTAPYFGVSRPPTLAYSHAEGGAIIGGYVYRGAEFPELYGKYIFGDNISNTIWSLDESTTPATKVVLTTMPTGRGPSAVRGYTGLSSFGLNGQGELLLCQMSSVGGHLYKLERNTAAVSQMPASLSATGVFSDLTSLAPAEGFMDYEVNAPFWSDGAQKKRWFAIPTGEHIDFAAEGAWGFPEGSVFVKHFDIGLDESDPSSLRRLETRVLVRDATGEVYGGTYRWRADGSDADLVISSQTEDLEIKQLDSTMRHLTWTYPVRQDCLTCHTRAAGGVLGLTTRQANKVRHFEESGLSDNQLRAWSNAGYFSTAPDEESLPSLGKLASLDDFSASLEHRARSYLDANCVQCHRPGGAGTFWDARIETPLAAAQMIDGPVTNPLYIDEARVIAPGSIARSILYQRLNTTEQTSQMPPLGRHSVDAKGVALLRQWIESMEEIDDPTPSQLPTPWQQTDLGYFTIPGSGTASNEGVFTLQASGLDFDADQDSFHYVYREMTGSGRLVARLGQLNAAVPSIKAGVMIRESLDPGAAHAATMLTLSPGARFQRRTALAGEVITDTYGAAESPSWVSIERRGDLFIGRVSTDGVNWEETGREIISMGESVTVGLALTSGDLGLLGSASFEQIALSTLPPFLLTGQPQSKLVKVGEPATLEVTTIGTPSTYRWTHEGTVVPMASGPLLTFPSAALANGGSYQAVLDESFPTEVATLAVVEDALREQIILAGQTATLYIAHSGSGISFQWEREDGPIPQATQSSLSIADFQASHDGDYFCTVTGPDEAPRRLGPYHLHLLRPPALTSVEPPKASLRGAFHWTLAASEVQTSFLVTGLPPGLYFDPTAQIVYGVPTVAGTYKVLIIPFNPAGVGPLLAIDLVIPPFADTWNGTYVGLVSPQTEINRDLGGRFRITVTHSGRLSGRLNLAGKITVFRGALNDKGAAGASANLVLNRQRQPPISFAITLDAQAVTAFGAVSMENHTALLSGRSVVSRETAARFAQRYRLSFYEETPAGQTPVSPKQAGHMSGRITRAGSIIMHGRIRGGPAMSLGSRLTSDFTFPFYKLLYQKRGALQGSPVLDPSPTGVDIAGTLLWRNNGSSKPTARGPKAAFDEVLQVVGQNRAR